MFYIACTRFNNKTYDENARYRLEHDETVIYGSTLKIREKYPVGCLIFVAEMNNEKNQIEAISLIQNSLVLDKKYKIYENNEYNAYIYRGKYRLTRAQLLSFNHEIVDILDNALFKGKSHLKCRIGITIITEKLLNHWNFDLQILKNMIKDTFQHYYFNTLSIHNAKPQQDSNQNEFFEIEIKKKRYKTKRNKI